MAPPTPVYVLGVGMTKFIKPRGKVDYPALGLEASTKALLDAHITYDDVDAAVACYCYGDSTCGQRVLYQLGMTQVPIYNVNNNCSTGSTGLALGRSLIAGGSAGGGKGTDCVLVVGFEKMMPGSLKGKWEDRASPLGGVIAMMADTRGVTGAPAAAQMFGNAGVEYGATEEDFAEIARVNHAHSPNNPYSQFQDVYTREQILASQLIHSPLTKLQCCPTSDGGASAVLVSQSFLDARPHLRSQAVLIAGQSMTTDAPSMYSRSAMDLVGYDMTRRAASVALSEAGITAADVRVVELHDCFSANEMVTLDALGLCDKGKAHEMVRKGDITYGGRYLVNPSGGLISKGHPLGATGLAQCAELVWHLRGWANNRGVDGTRWALQHNLGLGGACVVTVYRRADGAQAVTVADAEVAGVSGVGYNPAVEARGVTEAEAATVRSKLENEWARKEKLQAKF
ncbi:probable sterol carrier protein [Cephalotrichum gorgonifer]|uniref:propanoyl-CoA C-acyltransferase n=1 Tax=Cephalotrichum gorgonifer TaxID=2041049 RepID=A0AAE8SWM2_9PEZI|nr:probable sterol carrier protein [Cephalotrichum gorgonifer]